MSLALFGALGEIADPMTKELSLVSIKHGNQPKHVDTMTAVTYRYVKRMGRDRTKTSVSIGNSALKQRNHDRGIHICLAITFKQM